MDNAKRELRRAKELGYAVMIEEYLTLLREIEEIRGQLLHNKKGILDIFSRLKNKMNAFTKRLFHKKKQGFQKNSN